VTYTAGDLILEKSLYQVCIKIAGWVLGTVN